MKITINIPDHLYQSAKEIAEAENVTLDELLVSAFLGLREFERLKAKASRGSYEKFQRVMAKVPAVEPSEDDRLDE